ncbi:NAD-dependent epimerase/dehydratase family protein [Neorhizobium alkalisoli]|uniref:dTDP-6-deoxy-L-talose 4-dehydrogenase (NAD+) n=1 Tax=Neorhizobium alkalisoli TaxID=528178 RepID=A0A561QSS5_9HYPH|nr:NAD(P)-dependent oxidoreductase [Neorhizobium alkalisoli]TWF53359.1 dTDP-6-deoxy-L-talose 4-dehydrogenase (NAD+) [Neorhizobium alkalisoli]
MSAKVLLTGATGFVGRQILRALADAGTSVRAVVREGSESRLPADVSIEKIIASPDIFSESAAWWQAACEGIDTVVHAAWYAEPGQYLQSPRNLDCLEGSLEMAKGAAEARVRRFIGIGTCFEYDLSLGMLKTDAPIRPTTPYAGAKAATFMALSQYLPLRHVDFAWCRLFYLYGEGEDARRLVPYLHQKLSVGEPVDLTSGNQIRDFVDVAEAGRQIAAVALGETKGPVNICSGIPITVRQMAERIADEYGRRDLLRFGARPDNLIDPPCVVGVKDQSIPVSGLK